MRASKYIVVLSDEPQASPETKITRIADAVSCRLSSLICMNPGGAKLTYRAHLTPENGVPFKWQPGDSISLRPPNSEGDVDWMLDRITDEIGPDQLIEVQCNPLVKRRSLANEVPIGHPITPRMILRDYVELHAIASRKTTKLMAECTKDVEEQKSLLLLSDREGIKLYDGLIKAPSTTILDLFCTFSSCRPSLSQILEIFPPLTPRPYSIIHEYNDSSTQSIYFAFSMVDFTASLYEDISMDTLTLTRYRRTHGVSTGWLKRLSESQSKTPIPISLDPNLSQFRHPPISESGTNPPLIMVCAGTGIAPFIGFLQFRRRMRIAGCSFGESWLIFGCRDPRFDLLFADEVADFLGDGTLSTLCLCFSRFNGDLPATVPSIIKEKAIVPENCKYVQDCILNATVPADNLEAHFMNLEIGNNADLKTIQQLVFAECGHIRVCGDAKGMAAAVSSAFSTLSSKWQQQGGDCAAGDTNWTKAGVDYLTELRRQKRFIEDSWC